MTAFRSRAQQEFLTQARDRGDRNQRYFERAATPDAAANIAAYSMLYPTNTSTLGLALTAAGIPASDPLVKQVTLTENQGRDVAGPIDKPGEGWFDLLGRGVDEFIWDPLKGTVRWGMMALMTPYELTAGGYIPRVAAGGDPLGQAPFLVQSIHDVFKNPADTLTSLWKETTTADQQQEQMLRTGELKYTSNQSSGWLPGSDVDPDVQANVNQQMAALETDLNKQGLTPNEKYRRQLEAAPQIWRDSATTALQQGLGRPMWDQTWADRESIMFKVPNIATGGTVYTPWSPGRMAAATIFEPGTTEFAAASGIGDFASQIWLDPLNYVGGFIVKAGLKALGVAAKQEKIFKAMAKIRAMDMVYSDIRTGMRVIDKLPEAGKALEEGRTLIPTIEGITGELGQTTQLFDRMSKSISSTATAPIQVADDGMSVFSRVRPLSDDLAQFADATAREAIDTVRPHVGEIPPTPKQPMGGGHTPITGPTSPPGWLLDQYWEDITAPIRTEKIQAGHYVIGDMESSNHLLIEKEGKKWRIYTPEGAAVEELDKNYKTLKEAEKAAQRHLTGYVEEPGLFGGQTLDDFIEHYDDVWIDDEIGMIDVGTTPGKNIVDTDRPWREFNEPRFYRTSRVRPDGGNAKIRVFGKTLDVAGEIPEEAAKILRRANKLDKNGYKGFGDPLLDKLPDELFHWMRTNGYGKLRVGDRVLVLDDFIGGRKGLSPFERQWFVDGAAPMARPLTPSGVAGPTPDDINRHFDWLTEISTSLLPKGEQAVAEVVERGADTVVRRGDELVTHYEYQKQAEFLESMVKDLEEAGDPHGTLDHYRKQLEDWHKMWNEGEILSGPGARVIPAAPEGAEAAVDTRNITQAQWDALPDDAWIDVYHVTDERTAGIVMEEGVHGKIKKQTPGEKIRMEKGATPEGLYVGRDPEAIAMYGSSLKEGEAVTLRIRVRKGDILTPREGAGATPFKSLSIKNVGGVIVGDIPPENVSFIARTTGDLTPPKYRPMGALDFAAEEATKRANVLRQKIWDLANDRSIDSAVASKTSKELREEAFTLEHISRLIREDKIPRDAEGNIIFRSAKSKRLYEEVIAVGEKVAAEKQAVKEAAAFKRQEKTADAVRKIQSIADSDPERWAQIENALANTQVPTGGYHMKDGKLQPTQFMSNIGDPRNYSIRGSIDMDLFLAELKGNNATKLVNEIYKAVEEGPHAVDRIFSYFDRKGIPVPLYIRAKIMKARDPQQVERYITEWLLDGPGMIKLPGTVTQQFNVGALTGKGRGIYGVMAKMAEKPFFARRVSAMLPTEGVNIVEDPDRAYQTLVRILPNYNIIRGSEEAMEAIEYVDKAGNSITAKPIEEILERLRNVKPGDPGGEAFEIMGDYAQHLFVKTLQATDGDAGLAKAVTSFFGETDKMRKYDVGRTGITGIAVGNGDTANIAGKPIMFNSPIVTSQTWNGAINMPNQKLVKRVLNETDRVGRIANRLTSKVGYVDEAGKFVAEKAVKKGEIDLATGVDSFMSRTVADRAWFNLTTSAMNKIWKPLVLLRGAWTFRIALDDQMRIAAEGFDSIFNHPFKLIGYAISRPDDWRSAFAKGFVDINGVRFDKDALEVMQHGWMYKASMMEMPDQAVGPLGFGHRHWVEVAQGSPKYADGLATNLAQYGGDKLMRRLAQSDSTGQVARHVRWLNSEAGTATRLEYARIYAKDPELAEKIRQGDEYVLRALVEQQYANLHHASGGLVLVDDANGHWVAFEGNGVRVNMKEYPAPPPRPGERAKVVVLERGDRQILDVLAGREGVLENPLHVRKVKSKLDPEDFEAVLSDRGYAEFRQLVGGKVKEAQGARFPTTVSADDVGRAGYPEDVKSIYNKGLRNFFSFFMGKPSDWLSRSPLFKQTYWRTVGQRLPFMSDEVRAAVLETAREANVEKDILKIEKKMLRTHGNLLEGVEDQIVTMEQIDEYAKAAALGQVEETLFDLANKRNISDSLNLIFPFVEAWGEFISRWSRLLTVDEHAFSNVNMLRKGINGARLSDPFDLQSKEGFFHENEYGQEVFSYPAFLTKSQMAVHNVVNNLPGVGGMLGPDIDPSYADSIDTTGSVQSLNFAAGIIPGFGPVFQMAAQKALPDDPSWDWMRNIIAPFGTQGTLANRYAPAWVKRLMSADGSDDAALNATWMSTVQDVMRTMMDRGEFAGLTTAEEVNAKVAEAEEKAKSLLMVRAASTWWMPVAPQYRFQKEDKNGLVWSYSNLGAAYRDILYGEAESDPQVAYDMFIDRYGFLPTAFSAPSTRTYGVTQRSTTEEGWVFEREHPELFDRYPTTAMFLDPTLDGEQHYDHARVVAQLEASEREHWTAEQMAVLADTQLGNIWWEQANKNAVGMDDPSVRNAYLADVRAQIQAKHPLWRATLPGKRQGVTNDQQMAEVEQWVKDPQVMDTPVARAAAKYLNLRQQILDTNEELLGVTTIDGSKKEEAQYGRKMLRQLAEELSATVPEFDPLWRNVFADEVSPRHDGYDQTDFELYGENIFAETMGVG